MRRLERLVAIALFLGVRRRALAAQIADKFGVSLRAVYRDVCALVLAGFPVEGSPGDGYRLPQESYLRPLALTADEAEQVLMTNPAVPRSRQSIIQLGAIDRRKAARQPVVIVERATPQGSDAICVAAGCCPNGQ